MTISWYGFNYFKVQNSHYSIIFNPYSLDKVTKFSKAKADVILFSDSTRVTTSKFNDEALVIDSPGEYEASNIFVYSRQVEKNHSIFLVIFEDMKIAFLGEFGHQDLSNGDLELIEGADILILPVGGGDFTTGKEAIKIISQIEPRIVVPSCHLAGTFKLKTDSIASFIKEFGVKVEEVDKLKIQKKDLPQEDVKLIVLKLQK